jgi:hypothetical protein
MGQDGTDTPEDSTEVEDIVKAECENGTILRYRAVRTYPPDRTVYADPKRETVTIEQYIENKRSLETGYASEQFYQIVSPADDTINIKKTRSGYQGPVFRVSPTTQAKTFDALWERVGGFQISDHKVLIPVDVAMEGKPAIAAYLKTAQQLGMGEVAEQLEISPTTVRQYLAGISGNSR